MVVLVSGGWWIVGCGMYDGRVHDRKSFCTKEKEYVCVCVCVCVYDHKNHIRTISLKKNKTHTHTHTHTILMQYIYNVCM